jgi:uncharacterized protein GlcG (DUF336 family)
MIRVLPVNVRLVMKILGTKNVAKEVSEMNQNLEPTPRAWKAGNLLYGEGLALGTARMMLEAGEKEARKQGVPVSMAIVDSGGNLLAFHRMDHALLGSIQIAMDKAYTAVFGKRPTAHWKREFDTGALVPGFIHERWISFGGGYLIERDGIILGGIGVSGGTVEDHYVARTALTAASFSVKEVDASLAEAGVK